ncbi:MAG: hypothetical protein HY958_00750 [Bacteroidia bacterium]|nr:hypothetical protein [Bacteroidia bacterium]
MDSEDLKKIQEIALRQLLESNEALEKKISEKDLEIIKLKELLHSDVSPEQYDIAELLEKIRVQDQKIALLESDLNKLRNTSISETLLTEPVQLTIAEDKKNLSKKFLITTIDSTVLYLISYILIFSVFNLITLYVAHGYGIKGSIRYFGIYWNVPAEHYSWSPNAITGTFISGPLLSLFIGAFIFFGFRIFRKFYYKIKLLFAWTMLHCFNLFFGSYISGLISGEGVGLFAANIQIDLQNDLFIAILVVLFMYFIGTNSAPPFLRSACSAGIIDKQKPFLLYQVLLPYFAGSILIIVFKLPGITLNEILSLVTLSLLIAPMFFPSSLIFVSNKPVNIWKNYRVTRFDKELLILSFILLLSYRIFLR